MSSIKKRGLGRGLGDMGMSALLGGDKTVAVTEVADVAEMAVGDAQDQLKRISLTDITPGRYQPRQHIDQAALEELASSIRSQGVIQPIVVRRVSGDTSFELIAGERRWRAAQLAGLESIPAIIRDLTDQEAMAVALIENIQRRELNAIEEASAFVLLIEEFNMTHQEVADAVGKSRTVVTNLLRLLKLNTDVRQLVEQGKLDMGHARALLALEGRVQSRVAEQVVENDLSVRDTEAMIRARLQPSDSDHVDSVSVKPMDSAMLTRQRDVSDFLGAKVNIKHHVKGKGKLVIQYNSPAELDNIIEKIKN